MALFSTHLRLKKLFLQIITFLSSRIFIVSLLLLVQVIFFFFIFSPFFDITFPLYTLGFVFSFATVIFLVSTRDNPSYKLVWTIFILTISPIGALNYWLFGWQKVPPHQLETLEKLFRQIKQLLVQNEETFTALMQDNREVADQSYYLEHNLNFPLYQQTQTQYFKEGEFFFTTLKEQLQKAEKFIFMEYFIIDQQSKIWQDILEILSLKAQEGVEVRLLYDDMGCLFTLPSDFVKKMQALQIQAVPFNRFRPFLQARMNNRDHRKITIIDGKISFTGGINLADEYLNWKPKHGHWKDTAIMLEGEATWTLTVIFLQLWNFVCPTDTDYQYYRGQFKKLPPTDGFVQPFADSPQDSELVSRNVYLNLINRAERELIITTPYLIIDNETITALCLTAKNGLDVKIIVPGIADHWYSEILSKAFYLELMEAGVKIYEYTPGFIHSKTIIADQQVGVIGSVNLDYRSLYLNFEAGVWLYQTQALKQLQADLEETLELCVRVKKSSVTEVNFFVKILRGVLRLFAPLM